MALRNAFDRAGAGGGGGLALGDLADAVIPGGLTLTGELTLPTSDPAGAANAVRLSAANAGRRFVQYTDPRSFRARLQPFIGRGKVMSWQAWANVAGDTYGLNINALAGLGTATVRTLNTTSHFTRTHRLGRLSAAGAGSFAGHRLTTGQFSIGDNATSPVVPAGGFYGAFVVGCSDPATVAGARQFVGVTSSVGAPSNLNPATLTNCIGLAQIDGSSNLHLVWGGSAAQTPIDLGVNFPAGTLSADMYTLELFAPPNASEVDYCVSREGTTTKTSGTLTGAAGVALPAATTLLTFNHWRCNNATALIVGLDIASNYVEVY